MHNSPRKNLEFQITFTETNLMYELGAEKVNEQRVESLRVKILELKKKLVDFPIN